MNKLLVALSLVLFQLFCVLTLKAQTIEDGSKWWDGTRLYTAQVDVAGDVLMVGESEDGRGDSFKLKKVKSTQTYTLAVDNQSGWVFTRAKAGWKVDYVSHEMATFLAVRKPNGDCVYFLTQTTDNLATCVAQQKVAEEHEVSWMMENRLLNAAYLGQFTKAQLRLMRNEILARHGWVFQSQDLKDYFGSQPWYQPLGNNYSVKLSVIEQTNLELITSEEALSDKDRALPQGGVVSKPIDTRPKQEEEAPKKGEEPQKAVDVPKKVEPEIVSIPKKTEVAPQKAEPTIDEVIFIATEEQFLKALGNNRVVEIGTNVHLNLSTILYQRELFAGVAGRVWSTSAQRGGSTPTVICEPCGDGHQLTLQNFSNLIIRGQNNSSIEVDARYAFCLNLIDCTNCKVENLTIGHSEGGTCEGGVIGMTGGQDNSIVSCDLYGCGTYGIVARETKALSVSRTNIHDCTYGIMELWDSEDITFEDCDFFHNREFDLISNMDSPNTVFRGCRFYDNWVDVALFVSNLDIKLYNCEIYHPVIGSKKKLREPDNDCKWSNEERYVPSPRTNPIGPDVKSLK